MIPTLRRLNDPERYYGLSWRGWAGALAAGGMLYVAVRFSPLGVKPTVMVATCVLVFAWMAMHAMSGQAIGPGRLLVAWFVHWRGPKAYECPDEPDKRGLVLDVAPEVEW